MSQDSIVKKKVSNLENKKEYTKDYSIRKIKFKFFSSVSRKFMRRFVMTASLLFIGFLFGYILGLSVCS